MRAYIRFAENINQYDGRDCHQCNDNVHAQNVHIGQTGVVEQFLNHVHHWNGSEAEQQQYQANAIQIIFGSVGGNIEIFKYDDSQQ